MINKPMGLFEILGEMTRPCTTPPTDEEIEVIATEYINQNQK